MSYTRVLFVACLAAFSASILASTGDPLHQMVSLSPMPWGHFNNWNETLTARRMCNSGALGHDNEITLDFLLSIDGTDYYQAGWGNYDSAHSFQWTLTGTSQTPPASAYCRTYGGVTGGQFYETSVGGVPCWWDSSGGGPNRVDYGSPKETGLFWDVNHDSYGYDTFAGYYFDGTYKQGCVWNASPGPFSTPTFPTKTGYNGSECRCINSSDDVAGQVFGSSSSPPAFWHYVSGTTWTLVVPSAWPSGRNGYFVGITDRDSNNNVYAVGYEEPPSGTLGGGQPFVYNYSTGDLRFLGTQYGPPTQISNEPYDVTDPIVSFSGNSNTTGLAYIWRGSPDPSSTYTGVFDDVWAYFDPEVAQYSGFAPNISGLNSDFQFGGFVGSGLSLSPWMVDNDSAWTFASASGYSLTTGTLTGGSLSDLATANGRFAQIKAYAGTGPQTIVEADWTTPDPTGLSEIGFRATDELDLIATNTYIVEVYNNTSGGWDQLSIVRPSCPTYWQTQRTTFPVWVGTDLSPYINPTTHQVRERISINVTGSTSQPYWYVDIDQLTFSYK